MPSGCEVGCGAAVVVAALMVAGWRVGGGGRRGCGQVVVAWWGGAARPHRGARLVEAWSLGKSGEIGRAHV